MIGNKNHYVIAGATGLVGSHLLLELLDHPETGKVTSLVRQKTNAAHPKLQEIEINWDTFTEKTLPPTADAVFCCLGTTMKKAGGRDAFKTVDYDYVVKLAVFTQRMKIPQFHVISAKGADMDSKIFYNKVKGRMEMEVQKLDKIRSIYIYRPSLLLGKREETRPMEKVGAVLMKAFAFLLPKSVRAIQASTVASAMFHYAQSPKKGVNVVDSGSMQV